MSNGELLGTFQNPDSKTWENERKCYVYYLPNLKQDDEFLEDFSHIVLTYSPNLQNEWKTTTPEWTEEEKQVWENSKQDSNAQDRLKEKFDTKHEQQQHIWVYTSTTENELIKANNLNNKASIKKISNIQVYTKDFVGDINNDNIFIFTLDVPLDEIKFKNNQQQVFRSESINTTIDGFKKELLTEQTIIEIDVPTEISFIDIRTWENESKYIEIDLKKHSTQAPLKNLTIEMNKYAEIYSIEAEGETNGNPTQAVVSINNQNLMPTLTNIIDDQGKLTKYYPWLDLGMHFASALKFANTGKVADFVTDSRMQKVIVDLLLLAYAKKANYNFVHLVEPDASGDTAKFLGSQRLTNHAIPMANVADTAIEETINETIDYFLVTNQIVEHSVEWQSLRQFLAAISQLIPGKLSVAGGKNNFHELYLPWTLKQTNLPLPEINRKVPNPNLVEAKTRAVLWSWVLTGATQTFSLKSKWFAIDKNNRNIQLLPKYNLSNVKSFQVTHFTTLPSPPDLHQALEKDPIPENVEFEKDLQFLAFHFIDPTKLKKYFDTRSNITPQTTTVLTTATKNSLSIEGLENKPTNTELAKLIGINAFVSGTIGEKWEATKSFSFKDFSYDGTYYRGEATVPTYMFKPYFDGTTVRLEKQLLPQDQQTVHGKYVPISREGTPLGEKYPWFYGIVRDTTSKAERERVWRRLWNWYDFSDEIKRILLTYETDRPNFRIKKLHYPAGSGSWGFWPADTIYTVEYKAYFFNSGYKYNTLQNWSVSSEPLNRIAVFDKVHKMIKLEPLLPLPPNPQQPEQLPLELTFEFPLSIKKITIRRDWGNQTTINLNGFKHTTTDWNIKNELVAIDKYIYL